MAGNIARLYPECGQSAWLDNIQRNQIASGELAKIRDRGVRGLTSNPAIFQKAIQGSSDYDQQFSELVRAKFSIEDAYWEMVLQDIEGALSVFRPVYDSSSGSDGFVSVEVDPRLAHDTQRTIDAARWLRTRIASPNVMIKIPATKAGIPAIEEMIAEGCNVNVTLIFSIPRYEEVMNAYIRGLERFNQSGGDLATVASVASFFISRVDSEIDKQLEASGGSELLGTAAVNQGVLAYERFRQVFAGERWSALQQSGERVQRPLWASTSTKNPNYPDTIYVDTLIGPDTVNTLPENTLEAFDDHGTLTRSIDTSVDKAHEQWRALSTHGVDVDKVAEKLEVEGVAAFIKAFDELLEVLAQKATTFTS